MKTELLKDKVVVVTGGAGLIGQELIRAIVENGGISIMADINCEIGKQVAGKLSVELDTKSIDFVKLDITSENSLKKCIEILHAKYGKIDAIVNNAYPRNKNYGRDFFEVEYEDFCENVNLHLGGYFLTSQQFAKYFLNQGYGNIVNMSSIYGVIAPRFELYEGTKMSMPVEYAAIKSAILHLTKYMTKRFKGMNIRVNAISPGGILNNQPEAFLEKYNDMSSSKGMLDKSDIKGTLVYLISDMSEFVNGQNIVIDDGWAI